MEIYEIIEQGKNKQGIKSDRGFAIANNISPQAIVDAKSGKSKLDAYNYLKVLQAAGLTVEKGLEILESKKQAGFAQLELLAGLLGLSLAGVGAMAYSPSLSGLALFSFLE